MTIKITNNKDIKVLITEMSKRSFYILLYIITFLIIACTIFVPAYIHNFSAYSVKTLYTFAIWGIGLICLGILLIVGSNSTFNINNLFIIITFVSGIEALFIILSHLHHTLFLFEVFLKRISFDNVAGEISCLCPSFPFAIYLAIGNNLKGLFGKITVVLIVTAILLTESRTGILSLIIVIFMFVSVHSKRHYKYHLFIIIIVPLILLLYSIRPNSANGRVLILNVILPKIHEIPAFGYGINGFREKYMDLQAEYFRTTSDANFSMLADNILYPFNEYIHLYFCFGFVGIFILFILAVLFFKLYKRFQGEEKFIILLAFLSLCILSLFSYPFNYAYPYLIMVIGFCILCKDSFLSKFILRHYKSFGMVMIPIGMLICYNSYINIESVFLWRDAFTRKDLYLYQNVFKRLEDNPYFLYNYSSILLEKDKLNESHEIALRCRQRMSSYNLELLLGEINQKKCDFDAAEIHYSVAKDMCPCRFIPLYLLMCLYQQMEEKDKELAIAKSIVSKSIKVPSKDVSKIRVRAHSVIKSWENNHNEIF